MGLKGTIHLNFADPLLVKMTCLVHNGTFFYTFQCTIAKKNDIFSRQKTHIVSFVSCQNLSIQSLSLKTVVLKLLNSKINAEENILKTPV